MVEIFVSNVSPSVDQLTKIGFTFVTDPATQKIVKATLPEGWTLEYGNIIDNVGSVRGTYTEFDGVRGISLRTYYGPILESCGNNRYTVYFGHDDEKLFVVGVVDASEYYKLVSKCYADRFSQEGYGASEEVQRKYGARLAEAAKCFNEEVIRVCDSEAKVSYPGWNDVDNYWPKSLERKNGKN